MLTRILAVAVVLLCAMAGVRAEAASYLGSLSGNVNQVEDLLGFAAIDDVSGIVLLGIYDDSEQTAGLSFVGDDPLEGEGALTGEVLWGGAGHAVYYTVKAGNTTGLYGWMPAGGNTWDTCAFSGSPCKGFSNARVWGKPGGTPPIPEPTAALVFGLGALLTGASVRRR